jgi:hypothetical protein
VDDWLRDGAVLLEDEAGLDEDETVPLDDEAEPAV